MKHTNILIGCEFSGRVRDAFKSAAVNRNRRITVGNVTVHSCDLLPTEKKGNHIQADIFDAIASGRQWGQEGWDLIGLHPPRTALCVSGNHKYSKGKPGWPARLEALAWTLRLWEAATAACPRVYLENPVGVLTSLGGLPPASWVQPWHYGADASKRTGLHLHGLPPLERNPAAECPPRYVSGRPRWGNQTDSGQNRLGPSPGRAAERARTYPGIADAMAKTWLKECFG